MSSAAWLVKSEPSVYSWDTFLRDKRTVWDGVRNFEARNNLRAMSVGDLALFYHSGEGKEIVGVAKIVKAAYPDPKDGEWSAVDLAPVKSLATPVTLATIKATAKLKDMALVRKSRLSVGPVTKDELTAVLALAKTRI